MKQYRDPHFEAVDKFAPAVDGDQAVVPVTMVRSEIREPRIHRATTRATWKKLHAWVHNWFLQRTPERGTSALSGIYAASTAVIFPAVIFLIPLLSRQKPCISRYASHLFNPGSRSSLHNSLALCSLLFLVSRFLSATPQLALTSCCILLGLKS
jgi:hypothetical protein